jgi:uncharacterized protein (TIGR03086 family)
VRSALGGSVELLGQALGYTRDRLDRAGWLLAADPAVAGRPTPCAGWTLDDLLAHMDDALDAFTEAAGGAVEVRPGVTAHGLVPLLQEKACALLTAWSRPAPGDVVLESGATRVDLVSPLLVGTAALEVTVHGWDVGRSTGEAAPLPDGLAYELLPLARAVVAPGDRGTRFAAARPSAPDAAPGEALLAFLGRA